MTRPERDRLTAFYRRYLDRCNEHAFDRLGEFLSDDVEVNGAVVGPQRYGAGLQTVVDEFPDFHWDLRHLLVDGEWLAAHLLDTGTGAGGRSLTLQEFAVYRIVDDRIAAVWGDLDRQRWATG